MFVLRWKTLGESADCCRLYETLTQVFNITCTDANREISWKLLERLNSPNGRSDLIGFWQKSYVRIEFFLLW